eukprot:2640-Heterococcus_DN1.PRE.4
MTNGRYYSSAPEYTSRVCTSGLRAAVPAADTTTFSIVCVPPCAVAAHCLHWACETTAECMLQLYKRQIAYGCSVRCASELSTTMTPMYEQIITQLKTLSAQNKHSCPLSIAVKALLLMRHATATVTAATADNYRYCSCRTLAQAHTQPAQQWLMQCRMHAAAVREGPQIRNTCATASTALCDTAACVYLVHGQCTKFECILKHNSSTAGQFSCSSASTVSAVFNDVDSCKSSRLKAKQRKLTEGQDAASLTASTSSKSNSNSNSSSSSTKAVPAAAAVTPDKSAVTQQASCQHQHSKAMHTAVATGVQPMQQQLARSLVHAVHPTRTHLHGMHAKQSTAEQQHLAGLSLSQRSAW